MITFVLLERVVKAPYYWYGRLVGHQPLVVYLCVCVSADMLPYCSVHDEWLIMKRCMYVSVSSYQTVTET